MFIVIGILIALIIWGVIRLRKYEISKLNSDTLDILKERYAGGELSKEDFEQIEKDLSSIR